MKKRAPRNRTLSLTDKDRQQLEKRLIRLRNKAKLAEIEDRIINQDFFDCISLLPDRFVDLAIIDPPYNLTKDYHGRTFKSKKAEEYVDWFRTFIDSMLHVLKRTATIYVCSDWQTSNLIFPVLNSKFNVINRITWEREKGRGAKYNWKNNTEDIWFCTNTDEYFFNVEAVKLKRRVLAPYRTKDGKPKDWQQGNSGNYRLTHPSNIWNDLTVPFWSMPENTDHPTQKPEKLIAKLILASSQENSYVFDPFLGSGTTAVVAKKLNRRFCGIEINEEYCCWTEKRLSIAEEEPRIQGYADGVFWERNTLADQPDDKEKVNTNIKQEELF